MRFFRQLKMAVPWMNPLWKKPAQQFMTNGSKEMENGHQQNKRNLSGSSPKRKKKKIACKSEKQSEFLKQADKLPKKIIIRKRNFRLHHITACIWLWKIGVN